MNYIAYILILCVTICQLSGQVILKRGINLVDEANVFRFLLQLLQLPHVWIALCVQGLGYVLWFFVLRVADVSVAFAILGGCFYVLLGLVSWMFLGERLGLTQWAGILLVTAGVICLTLNSNLAA